MKICTGCHIDKPLNDFGYSKDGRQGRKSRCKECIARYMRERYRTHPEVRVQQIARATAYRLAHSHQVATYNKQWQLIHDTPERRRLNCARMAKWVTENADRHRANSRRHQLRRRAWKRNQFIEDVDPQTLHAMHGGMCGICNQFIEGDFHVDHVTPLSKGGMHGYVNCQPAHPFCNWSKNDRIDIPSGEHIA